ncbi:MAG: cyclic nucleotide-binding domain-containing protein [Mariprofundaceae bacterium]|nr:cyclic nucleotide-binding domain-containing protein [Mariprofundaceae bacterium]
MSEKITKKDLEQALETYANLVELYPENEGYLQRYADMLQTLGREGTATITLQHLHDIIAERSEQEAIVFARKYPQIGRVQVEHEDFEFQDKHAVAGGVIHDALGSIWLRLHRKTLKEGQAVYRMGEAGDTLSLVLSGKVDVYTTGQNNARILLESVGSKDVVGEYMFMHPGKRVIDAFVASAKATVVEIPRQKLLKIIEKNPYLGQILAERSVFRNQVRVVTTNPVFQVLPLSLRMFLARAMELRTFKAGTLIHALDEKVGGMDMLLAGDACYLAQGRAGKKFMLPRLSLGSLTGDVTLKGGDTADIAELMAKTNVNIGHLPFAALINISAAFPPLKERLLKHANQHRLLMMKAFEKLKTT